LIGKQAMVREALSSFQLITNVILLLCRPYRSPN